MTTQERRRAHNARQTYMAYMLDTLPDQCELCGRTEYLWRRVQWYNRADGHVGSHYAHVCLDCSINISGAYEPCD